MLWCERLLHPLQDRGGKGSVQATQQPTGTWRRSYVATWLRGFKLAANPNAIWGNNPESGKSTSSLTFIPLASSIFAQDLQEKARSPTIAETPKVTNHVQAKRFMSKTRRYPIPYNLHDAALPWLLHEAFTNSTNNDKSPRISKHAGRGMVHGPEED